MSGKYQQKDRLYQEAKKLGYRSRAFFKLQELDKKHRLLTKGSKVLDLGCAPGGWLQLCSSKVGLTGVVVGLDLDVVEPFKPGELSSGGALPVLVVGDLRDQQVLTKIEELVGGRVDLILSDMSPKLSGISFRDALRSAELVEQAFELCPRFLCRGGAFVAKIFPGQEEQIVFKKYRPWFKRLSREVLDASRKTSSELYFVGKDFQLTTRSDSTEQKVMV